MKVWLGVLGLEISLKVFFIALGYQSPEPGNNSGHCLQGHLHCPLNGHSEVQEQDSAVGLEHLKHLSG